jgi:3-(3-hydroxy-phenyl)propionate hydroxylase
MSSTASRDEERLLVVGAGPIGLTAALALRAKGFAVTVLEAEPEGRPRPGSRAIFVHRETLEHLEHMLHGVGWEIAANGLVWSTKRTFWGDKQVYERTYPALDPNVLPHSTNLSQTATEGLLLDACKRAGVEFAWNHRIESVTTSPDGVELTTDQGAVLSSPYVIAADGARSGVRRALRINMEGDRSDNAFVIVDVAEDEANPLRPERIYYYEHPAVEKRNVLLVPFAGGWRCDLQCRPNDDPTQFDSEDGVRRWVARVLPEKYADRVTWVSTYRFLQVVAETFVDEHRRVLLVGEAAHLFAPFGARGMNSGVPDAVVAAAAIRAATDDPSQARPAIEGFNETRREAALYNRDAAGLALAHMQARDLRIRIKRRTAAFLARVGDRSGTWLDSAPYGPRSRAKTDRRGTY